MNNSKKPKYSKCKVNVTLLHSMSQVSQRIMDCIKLQFDDIISLCKKNNSEGDCLSVCIFYILIIYCSL